MASSFTTNLDLEKPAPGDQANAWGLTLNSNFDSIDTAISLKYAGTPQGNLAGSFVGQIAVDTSNNIIYICTTAGNIGASVWTPSNLADSTIALTGDVTGSSSFSNGNVSIATTYATSPVPSGIISMFGGTSAPTGYLLCDGTAVSRTTYADLYAIIATNFGSGNGSSTFNLPNLQDKFPIGKGSTYSLNNTGGSSTFTPAGTNGSITPSGTVSVSGSTGSHTLTESEIPAHFHYTANTDNNFANGNELQNNTSWTFTARSWGGAGNNDYILYASNNNSSNLAGKSSSVGSSSSHQHTSSGLTASFNGNGVTPSFTGTSGASLPPYVCVNYIIKT